MITILFLGFVALMAAVVVALSARYLNGRTAFVIASGLFVWLIYVGLLGYFGVVRNAAMRPPGIAFIFVPVLVILVLSILGLRSSAGARVALPFPLWIILGTQSFRIVVELFLHQLWIDGLCPKMLTFAGANVDIYVGASAPRIAWLSTRGRSGMKFALIWNVLGLFAYSFDASSDVMAVGPDRVPGIASIVENASREPLPRADPKRFSIAVAHLS